MTLDQLPPELNNWPITIGVAIALIGGVVAVIKTLRWLDERFVSRREFEQALKDEARQEKLLLNLDHLVTAIRKRNEN